MAGFNGSGTFSRVYSSWVADRIAGTPITDTRMDDEFTGFVTGLTTTICRDGQSTTTARIPFAAGANVMTGAAAAVGLSITGDVGTGLWSSGATTNLSIAVAGTTRLSAGTAGVAVTGTLSSSGVFTGTTTAVFGANSGTGGAVKLYGATSGDATIKVAAAAGTSTIFQVPASNGTSGYVLTTDGSGVTSWLNPASIAGDLDVGTTAIVGGTTTRILYNNAGVLGEYTLSGTGTIVAMTAGPTFTGTIAGAALTLSTPLGAASGGTGVANNAASTLTISGNFATTLTVSATTGVTLPTTGTLATLAGTETFTNKTLTTAILNGTVTGTSQATANTASTLVMRDASGNFAAGTITANLTGNASGTALTVTQAAQTAITSLGTLTGLTMGGTLAMGSNALTSTGTMTSGVHTLAAAGPQIILGANTSVLGSVKMFGNTSGDVTLQPAAVAGTATAITLPAVTGTLATLAGTETFTNKTLTTAVLNGTITGTSQATANTASTLVMRDASGNFSAGTITTSTLAATTINAFTLAGTVAGGGNQINNVIIGTSTPLAGSFTTLSASSTLAVTGAATFSSSIAVTSYISLPTAAVAPPAMGLFNASGTTLTYVPGSGGHQLNNAANNATLLGITNAGLVTVTNTTEASAVGTASTTLAGGLSVAAKIIASGTITSVSGVIVQSTDDMFLSAISTGTIQSAGVRLVGRQSSVDSEWSIVAAGSGLTTEALRFVPGVWTGSPAFTLNGQTLATGKATVSYSTTASSTSAAALVVTGGVGIGDNLRVANKITAANIVLSVGSGDNGIQTRLTAAGGYNLNAYCTANSGVYYFACFSRQDNDVIVGTITSNGTTTAYNTTSDRDLKENIVDTSTVGMSLLRRLSVRDFNFKADPTKRLTTGFVAQEVYELFPDAVLPAAGDRAWQMDYGRITPLLAQSIKDVDADVQALTAELAAAKSRISELERKLHA